MKKINELFFMRPWAVKQDTLSRIEDIINRHMKGEKLPLLEISEAASRPGKSTKPDYEVMNGVARIPIYGVIAKRASMVNQISQPEGTSVEEIAKNFKAAMKDDTVKSIALDIDSPGGSVDGICEMADLIYAAAHGKNGKEVIAYAGGQMCSAAYWIGSSANKIYATKSSEVGSIGVYTVMTDWTVANHNEGVKRQVIKAGKNKATGHPDKPMTLDDIAVVQEEVDTIYKLFTEAVAKNRKFSQDTIEKVATGKVFIGQQALDAGLVDGIDEIDSALEGSGSASRAEEPTAGITAGKEQNLNEEEVMDLKTLTLDELKIARPDLLAAHGTTERAAGKAEGKAEEAAAALSAHNAEKARVSAIKKSAGEIKGVEATALQCIESGITAEASTELMKASKLNALKEVAPAPLGGGNDDAETQAMAALPFEEKVAKMWEKNVKVEGSGKGCRDEFSDINSFKAFVKYQGKGAIRTSDKK